MIAYSLPERRDFLNGAISTFCNRDILVPSRPTPYLNSALPGGGVKDAQCSARLIGWFQNALP